MDGSHSIPKSLSCRRDPPILFLSYREGGKTSIAVSSQEILNDLGQKLHEVRSAVIDFTAIHDLDPELMVATARVAEAILGEGISVNVLYPHQHQKAWTHALTAFPKTASLIPVKPNPTETLN